MYGKREYFPWAGIAALMLGTLACGLYVNLDSTATVPPPAPSAIAAPATIPISSATLTSSPEPVVQDTSVPSAAPEATGTDSNSEIIGDVHDYYGRGLLPFESGGLVTLEDFSGKGMTLGRFDFVPTRVQVQDFALWADIVLNTTGSTRYPDYTGCGFAYRVQNNSDGYTAILTNEAVRIGACGGGLAQCTLFGVTHGYGSGLVSVPNGTKVRFSLAVNKARAWVLLDGTPVAQYTLYTTRLMGTGGLYYASVSDINAGYRTACQISNVRVWQSHP